MKTYFEIDNEYNRSANDCSKSVQIDRVAALEDSVIKFIKKIGPKETNTCMPQTYFFFHQCKNQKLICNYILIDLAYYYC